MTPAPKAPAGRDPAAPGVALGETLRRAPLSAVTFALAYGLICAVIAAPDLVASLFR